MMGHATHDWPEIHGHCVPCLIEKLDTANLQVRDLQKALSGMIAIAEGSSGITPEVEAEIHGAKALIEKPKYSLVRPLNTETCVLAVGHRGACEFALKRVVPVSKCAVCGYSTHSGRCGEQGGSGPEDGYA